MVTTNKQIVEAYFQSKGTEYAHLLSDEVELIEWADGVPESGVRTVGKTGFVQNRGSREYQLQVTRLTEEHNVVVAEGVARGSKKGGGSWAVRFCNIFETQDGRIKRLTAFGASLKDSA